MGAAFDSLLMLLGTGVIVTIVVMALAIWRSALAGNLRTSFIRRKPLLIPSLVFTITIIITATYLPIPMSVYHGPNDSQYSQFTARSFRVYEEGAYEADTLVRVSLNIEPDDWCEIYTYFSQNETVIGTLLINMTLDDLDAYGGVTRSISLEPGLYDLSVNATYFNDGVEQELDYVQPLINQPVTSLFIPEITDWNTYRFIFGFVSFFLVLGGICIGREDRTRRSEEDIDQEPPREGEIYGKKGGW